MMIHALVLRIPVTADADLGYLTDALGETARNLEVVAADHPNRLGLVLDRDDPGRFAWSIVAESYPGIGE